MVLTVSSALSPVIGLFCHRHQADTSARLERQRRGVRTTRLHRPQAKPSSEAPLASTASRLAFRDDREPPLLRDGTGRDVEVIWVKREQEYFYRGGWTDKWVICPPRLGKSSTSSESGRNSFANIGPSGWKIPSPSSNALTDEITFYGTTAATNICLASTGNVAHERKYRRMGGEQRYASHSHVRMAIALERAPRQAQQGGGFRKTLYPSYGLPEAQINPEYSSPSQIRAG
jgi:hypothetical protein